MSRRLIENGTVVSMDPDVGDFERADILIADGEIVAIEPDISEPGAETTDASDAVVVPGFVNAHLHAYQSLFRGIIGDWTLYDYVETVHGPIDAALRPRDMYLGTLFSVSEQLASGVTTVFDFCHAVNSPEHADRAIDAHEEAGIRAVFAHGPPNGTGNRDEWHDDSTRPHPDYVRELREGRLADDDARVTLGMAMRGPDFTTQDVAEADLRLARDLDIPVSMHAGVSMYESYDTDAMLELLDRGLLGGHTSLVHGNSLTPETVDTLAGADVPIIVTPEIELQLGYEWHSIGPLLNAGRGPSLGSDIVCNVGGELFTQMRMALQTQRALDNVERIERGEQVRNLTIDARQALKWVTMNAARDIGLENRIGSLTPGKRADLVLISTDDINTIPGHSPVETVVFQAHPSNVDTVIVGGDVLKSRGELVDPAYSSLEAEFRDAADRLLEEAGVEH